MATRLKLRVCTWNVGNAQPPPNLSSWLGIHHEYDIIAIGAQEANFGIEKTRSPTSILSSSSPTATSPSHYAPTFQPNSNSFQSKSRAFKKLTKALKVAKATLSDNKSKKNHVRPASSAPESPLCPEQQLFSPAVSPAFAYTSSSPSLLESPRLSPPIARKTASDEVPAFTFSQFTKETPTLTRPQSSRTTPLQPWDSGNLSENETQQIPSRHNHKHQVDAQSNSIDFEPPSNGKEHVKSKRFRKQVTAFLRAEDDDVASGEKTFTRVIEKNMPSNFHLVAKHRLMEIKLILYVHERHLSRVVRTETVAEPTGIGNVVGNKGAVAVKLTLDDTTFCFVSSHLAAHEGAKFLQQRNDDVVEIMRNIERNKTHGLPVMHQFNHVFWMGDLNYRLNIAQSLPEAVTWSREGKFSYVTKLIEEKKYEELSLYDELRREMEHRKVFGGFMEGKLAFAPTFKVARGEGKTTYQQSRVPSYCDRILWHSLPLHRDHVRLCEYNAVQEIGTSDHKPVYASFDIVIPKPIRLYALPPPSHTLKCAVDFLLLQVHGLYEKRLETDENDVHYEVLEDGALGISPKQSGSPSNHDTNSKKGASHTRRVVTATFHGNGMFIKDKPYKTEVPLREGRREAMYRELPIIPLYPVESLSDLAHKYITIVFTRIGSKQGSSCVLPLRTLLEGSNRHSIDTELDLTKYGMALATVRIKAELVASYEGYVDARNFPVKLRVKRDRINPKSI